MANEVVIAGYTQEQIDLILRTICPGLTIDEAKLYLNTAQRMGLDPQAKQIYAIKRKGKDPKTGQWIEKMTIQVSIDGYRLVAERTGKYAPGQDTEFLTDSGGNLIGAKVYVKKQTPDGTWHSVSATAFISEYTTNQGLWASKPSVMIEKCAESRALRRCFPAEMSGVYCEEEMDQSVPKIVESSPIENVNLTISDIQVEEIKQIIGENVDLMNRFIGYLIKTFEIDKLEDIPLQIYPKLLADLTRGANGGTNK